MQPKTLLQIKDELAKEHGHSGWSAVKNKAVKGMLMVYDIIALCDEANRRFFSQTKAVEPARKNNLAQDIEEIKSILQLSTNYDSAIKLIETLYTHKIERAWVRIIERLPDNARSVIIHDITISATHVGYYNPIVKRWFCEYQINPTHWSEMPKFI